MGRYMTPCEQMWVYGTTSSSPAPVGELPLSPPDDYWGADCPYCGYDCDGYICEHCDEWICEEDDEHIYVCEDCGTELCEATTKPCKCG